MKNQSIYRCGQARQAVSFLIWGVMAIVILCRVPGLVKAETPQDPEATAAGASLAYERGDLARAIELWNQAVDGFKTQGRLGDQIQTRRLQATALRELGHFEQAARHLQEAVDLTQQAEDRSSLVALYSDLGALAVLTRSDLAQSFLDQAMAIASEDQDAKSLPQVHNNLGNLLSTQGQIQDALSHYLICADLAVQNEQTMMGARAFVNAASAALELDDHQQAFDKLSQALAVLGDCPDTYEKAGLLIAIGDRAVGAIDSIDENNELWNDFIELADKSATHALAATGQLKHQGMACQALALRAQLQELRGDLQQALTWTRRAVFAAQQAQSPHELYRQQWRSGRLLQGLGRRDESLAAYRRAMGTLEPIRADVIMGYGNLTTHGDFRSEVGSLYFGLADLLLQKARTTEDRLASQQHLIEARSVIERFKTAELVDYFQDRCLTLLETQQTPIEEVASDTAVVYFIPLPDRLEVLLSMPGGLKQFVVDVGEQELVNEVNRFRLELEDISTNRHLQQSQQLYDWLIAPIAGELDSQGIETLVFVPDGPLRLVPMSALHDGQRYLVERYAAAVTPGLTLTAHSPFAASQHRLLAAGLAQSVHEGFSALPRVPQELGRVADIFEGQKLLDEQFVYHRLQDELSRHPYSIVHIASHGHFGRNAQDTFILTYDTKLTLANLEQLIRPARFRDHPLELLTLSACDTAAGDDRAALGLAGIALRAGARSAVATLWSVQDEATISLISDFYQYLLDHPGSSKAKALQAAQIRMIRNRPYDDPFFWSPYLIIGNWL